MRRGSGSAEAGERPGGAPRAGAAGAAWMAWTNGALTAMSEEAVTKTFASMRPVRVALAVSARSRQQSPALANVIALRMSS